MRRLRPALAPAAAIALALVPSLVGITWGIPSNERFDRFLGERRAEAVPAIIERTREDTLRKAKVPAHVRVDTGKPDTPGRIWRRFALYSDHPDEMMVFFSLSRMRPSELKLDPGAYHYGGLFFYPLGVVLKVADWVGLATVTPDLAVYLEDPGRFGRFYVIGRLYVLVWHAAGLVALFLLARDMFGTRAAYLALAIYAMLPATVCFSHVLKPHFPGVTPVLFAALALRRLEGTKRMVVAGAFVGAATAVATPYVLWILLLPACLWQRGELKSSWRRLLAGAAVAAAVYAVLNPYIFLNFRCFLDEIRHGQGFYRLSLSPFAPVSYVRHMPDALTWPGMLAAAGALAWFVGRRGPDARVLLPPLAVHFVVVSIFTVNSNPSFPAVDARFGFFLYPFLALVTAGMLDSAMRRDRRWAVAAGALVLALLLGSVPHALAYSRNARGVGTRAEAGSWIDSHIPAGAGIGAWTPLAPGMVPAVDLSRHAWVCLQHEPGARPDWFLTVGAEPEPRGYREVAEFRPLGAGPVFASPERTSFAAPVFKIWARVVGLKESAVFGTGCVTSQLPNGITAKTPRTPLSRAARRYGPVEPIWQASISKSAERPQAEPLVTEVCVDRFSRPGTVAENCDGASLALPTPPWRAWRLGGESRFCRQDAKSGFARHRHSARDAPWPFSATVPRHGKRPGDASCATHKTPLSPSLASLASWR